MARAPNSPCRQRRDSWPGRPCSAPVVRAEEARPAGEAEHAEVLDDEGDLDEVAEVAGVAGVLGRHGVVASGGLGRA
jgi:hypothetical protein